MELTAVCKKESIVSTAIDLINECGMQMVSTREIAKRNGISQGTVFQYFPKKSDLLKAVLEHFSQYDQDLFDSTRTKNFEPKEAILYWIDSYLTFYENYPAITAVFQAYDILRNDAELGEKVRHIFEDRTRMIRQLVEEAQRTGVIQKTLNAESIADILLSTCAGMCLKWRMQDFGFSLRQQTLQRVQTLLGVFGP